MSISRVAPLVVALAIASLWPAQAQAWGLPLHVYYETSLVIIALILMGRWMEGRAKKRTAAAITALVGLAPAGAVPAWAWGGLGVAVLTATGAAVDGMRGGGHRAFLWAVATAAVAVTLLVARGSDLA